MAFIFAFAFWSLVSMMMDSLKTMALKYTNKFSYDYGSYKRLQIFCRIKFCTILHHFEVRHHYYDKVQERGNKRSRWTQTTCMQFQPINLRHEVCMSYSVVQYEGWNLSTSLRIFSPTSGGPLAPSSSFLYLLLLMYFFLPSKDVNVL